MHLLIHILIIFIFVLALLFLNFPKLQDDDYLKQKLYIFCGLFILEFILSLVTTIYQKCIIDIGKIVRESFQSALLGVVGYAIYTDLVWKGVSWTKDQTYIVKKLTLSILITALVSGGYLINSFFSPGLNDCLNTIYQQK